VPEHLRGRTVSRRLSVQRQLFRAGTLDVVVLTSNSFLMQCSAESGLIVAFPCLNLAGSRTCWLRRSQSFVVHMPYALSEF